MVEPVMRCGVVVCFTVARAMPGGDSHFSPRSVRAVIGQAAMLGKAMFCVCVFRGGAWFQSAGRRVDKTRHYWSQHF